MHIAVQNGWLKILKYFVENPSVELELRNEDGKTVIDLVKRKLKDKKQEDRHEYAEIFRRAEPCGFRKMEDAHIRMKMAKKNMKSFSFFAYLRWQDEQNWQNLISKLVAK